MFEITREGLIFSPSQVYLAGIFCPSSKAGLVNFIDVGGKLLGRARDLKNEKITEKTIINKIWMIRVLYVWKEKKNILLFHV